MGIAFKGVTTTAHNNNKKYPQQQLIMNGADNNNSENVMTAFKNRCPLLLSPVVNDDTNVIFKIITHENDLT